MSLFFCDTSAIVKRYVDEPGHHWITALCDPAQNHQIYISQAAIAEVVATLCRKAHERTISSNQRDALIDLFLQHRRRMYNTVRVTNAIYLAAGKLCKPHRLRAYDAIQLACALVIRDSAVAQKIPAPIFVCADNNLLSIAVLEGLAVENPNLHL